MVAIGNVDDDSKSIDVYKRGEGGRSVDVRGDTSDGVRDEGRIGTVLNAPTLSVTDAGGRGFIGMSLGMGSGVENIISGWVAVETGRKLTEPTEGVHDEEKERS